MCAVSFPSLPTVRAVDRSFSMKQCKCIKVKSPYYDYDQKNKPQATHILYLTPAGSGYHIWKVLNCRAILLELGQRWPNGKELPVLMSVNGSAQL